MPPTESRCHCTDKAGRVQGGCGLRSPESVHRLHSPSPGPFGRAQGSLRTRFAQIQEQWRFTFEGKGGQGSGWGAKPIAGAWGVPTHHSIASPGCPSLAGQVCGDGHGISAEVTNVLLNRIGPLCPPAMEYRRHGPNCKPNSGWALIQSAVRPVVFSLFPGIDSNHSHHPRARRPPRAVRQGASEPIPVHRRQMLVER